MGSLSLCIEHGLPQQILVPLLPAHESFAGKGAGKAPAQVDPKTGRWVGFDEWHRGGHNADLLRACDAAGGNAGVILGSPYDGVQLLAIDIDLLDTPNAVEWRNVIVKALQRRWAAPVLVRETWPYRALLLVNLPVDADPGAKKKFTVSFADPSVAGDEPKVIGAIEILARGQQAAIAGMHVSGNPMLWYFMSDGGQETGRYPAPPVKVNQKVTLPTFPDFDTVASSIATLLTDMAPYGFSYSMLAMSASTGVAPALADLAAPSADDIANLLGQTPNPASVDRDIYTNVMHAIAGAQAGLAAMRGALAFEDKAKIANAAAEWSSRWNAPQGSTASTFAEELDKWTSDWGIEKDTHFAGWRHLLIHCQAFGAPPAALADIAMQKAQSAFQADTSRPTPESELPARIRLNSEQLRVRAGVLPDRVWLADFAIAESMLGFFSSNTAWVPGLGKWLVWGGDRGWASDEISSDKVGLWITDGLWSYVRRHGQPSQVTSSAGWSSSTHEKMLSDTKVLKVTSVLKRYLAMASADINCGVLRLQTPTKMYDLADLNPVEIGRRKSLFETRATNIEPDPEVGDTKYFDKLTLDLCDGNTEVQDWLLHYIGYCMLGAPGEAVFVVVWGSGNNGKSTLARVLNYIFGSYAVGLDAQVIQESGAKMHPASLNRLRGKRLATITELDEGARWNNRVLKLITGGDDIEARDMNKNPTAFRSQAGLLIFSNDKPPIERADPAIQRRFRLIETVIRRQGSQIIKDLEERIKLEAPSVLRKLMLYAQKVYKAGGLPEAPAAMKNAANATMAETDQVFGWLHNQCEYGTAEVAENFESIDELRARCEDYIKRQAGADGGGGFVADKLQPKAFLDRLRREGISLEEPGRFGKAPVRHQRKSKGAGGLQTIDYLAKGIKLKVRAVA